MIIQTAIFPEDLIAKEVKPTEEISKEEIKVEPIIASKVEKAKPKSTDVKKKPGRKPTKKK